MPLDAAGEHGPGFIDQRLGHEPLDGDAGIAGQPHRSRSARSRSTLSVWTVPSVRDRSSRVRSRKPATRPRRFTCWVSR